MRKEILISLLLLTLIGLGTFYYFSTVVPEHKSQSLESSLPDETAMALYMEDFSALQTDTLFPAMWNHAVAVGRSGESDKSLLQLFADTELLNKIKGISGFITLVQVSKNSLGEMWVLGFGFDKVELESLIFKHSEYNKVEPRHFSGAEYFEYPLSGNQSLYVYFNNEITIVSLKSVLIERAIGAVGVESALSEFVKSNLPFQRNLFLNYDILSSGHQAHNGDEFKGLASFDWKWNETGVSLVGTIKDKSFSDKLQAPASFQLYGALNSGVESFFVTAMDVSAIFQNSENIGKLESEMGVNIVDELSNLFTHEKVAGSQKMPSLDENESRFFLMGVRDPKKLYGLLEQSAIKPDSLDSISTPRMWSALPQVLFNIESIGWEECHLSVVGKYLLATKNDEAAKQLGFSSEGKMSFLATTSYLDLQEAFESTSSSLSFFDLTDYSLDERQSLNLVFGSTFQKTSDGASLLFRTEKGVNEVFVEARSVSDKKKVVSKERLQVLWISNVDSTVAWGPFKVYNHSTKKPSILVCDEKAILYQMDHTGKVLWKRQLSGIPQGKPYELDVYKNNKVQYLVGNQQEIYLFDRKGRDVKHFPITLADTATSPIVCFNRGKNKSYEIFVGCENEKLYGFSGDGIPLGGWLGVELDSTLVQPIQYFVKDKKTHFFGHMANGKVQFWTKEGNPGISPIQLGTIGSTPFKMSFASTLENCVLTTSDTAGRLVRAKLSGKVEITRLGMWEGKQHLKVIDIDGVGNRDYLFSEGNRLIAYRENETHLFKLLFENDIINPPIVLGSTPLQFGIVLANGQTYLVDPIGEKKLGPSNVRGRLFTADLDDDEVLELITTKGKNTLVAYKMKND